MNLLWEMDVILAATGGRPVGDMPEGASGISIDSRTLQPGDMFFAIKGENLDGHDYLGAATGAGASLAVVDESKLVSLGHIKLPFVVVPDVLEALCRLRELARARTKAQIVAVTGSAGKTSTKEMLLAALSACGPTHASAASYNNQWGVPLTLARMPEDTRFGIFEIGMNHPGEIAPLAKMVRPHLAVITCIAPAHIGAFETIEDIAREKASIFSGVVSGGYALINHDDRRYALQKQLAGDHGIEHILCFGRKRGSDIWLRKLDHDADGSRLSVRVQGKDIEYNLPIAGEHMAKNSLVVMAAANLLGGDLDKAADALSRIEATRGRGNRYVIGGAGSQGITIIDESYNANPASMEAALNVLASFEGVRTKRRIAVLGDMLELGRKSEKMHRDLAKPIASAKVDLVFLVGPEMEHLAKILPRERLGGHFADTEGLAGRLKNVLRPGDVVMFKASKGIGFAPVVEEIIN